MSAQVTRLLVLSGLPLLLLGIQSNAKERFEVGRDYGVPHTRFRTNPHPNWARADWRPESGAQFVSIRKECESAIGTGNQKDESRQWQKKVKSAFDQWMEDCQDPVKLFRVSSYIAAARYLDHGFQDMKEYHKYVGYVNMGWNIIRKPPADYEFVRRGYLFNAGDTDFHAFGDLPLRLLQKNSADRSVIVAMVYDYCRRKPEVVFEKALFQHIENIAATPKWFPWDDFHWAVALRKHGQSYKRKDSYLKALEKADSALTKTPAGWDSRFIKDWMVEVKREMADPNFGIAPGSKVLDDIDPP